MPFRGLVGWATQIIEVEPGTEIEHEGEKLTVTEESAACLRNKIYVPPKMYRLLRHEKNPACRNRRGQSGLGTGSKPN